MSSLAGGVAAGDRVAETFESAPRYAHPLCCAEPLVESGRDLAGRNIGSNPYPPHIPARVSASIALQEQRLDARFIADGSHSSRHGIALQRSAPPVEPLDHARTEFPSSESLLHQLRLFDGGRYDFVRNSCKRATIPVAPFSATLLPDSPSIPVAPLVNYTKPLEFFLAAQLLRKPHSASPVNPPLPVNHFLLNHEHGLFEKEA